MTDDSAQDQTEPKEPIQKLDRLLQSAEEKGHQIAEGGRKATAEGQNLSDVAGATRKVVKYAGYVPNIEDAIDHWESVNGSADAYLQKTDPATLSPLVSSISTATYTSSGFVASPEVYLYVRADDRPRLDQAITVLSDVISRPSTKDEVSTLMQSLGLDTAPPGRKSALEQFLTAHEAFAKPIVDSNPIITSLIPMREAIRLTIDELLRRRPKQEKTPKEWDKIISIGSQLSYSTILPPQIRTWAALWTGELANALSPAKEQDITREEWSSRLTKSTLFLKSLLSGIDPAKLR